MPNNCKSNIVQKFFLEITEQYHTQSLWYNIEREQNLVSSEELEYSIYWFLQQCMVYDTTQISSSPITYQILYHCYQILISSFDTVMLINMLRFYAKAIELLDYSDPDEKIEKEIFSVIERALDPQILSETWISNFGDVIIIYFDKISQNIIQDFIKLLPNLTFRLQNSTSPVITESLLLPYFHITTKCPLSITKPLFSSTGQTHDMELDGCCRLTDQQFEVFVRKWMGYVDCRLYQNGKAFGYSLKILVGAVVGDFSHGKRLLEYRWWI